MNRMKLISAKSIIEDEISQYEDELSYLRAAKKNLETLIDKEPTKPINPILELHENSQPQTEEK